MRFEVFTASLPLSPCIMQLVLPSNILFLDYPEDGVSKLPNISNKFPINTASQPWRLQSSVSVPLWTEEKASKFLIVGMCPNLSRLRSVNLVTSWYYLHAQNLQLMHFQYKNFDVDKKILLTIQFLQNTEIQSNDSTSHLENSRHDRAKWNLSVFIINFWPFVTWLASGYNGKKQKFNVVNITNSVNMIIHEKNDHCTPSNVQHIKKIFQIQFEMSIRSRPILISYTNFIQCAVFSKRTIKFCLSFT
jgi:hypothetical protein